MFNPVPFFTMRKSKTRKNRSSPHKEWGLGAATNQSLIQGGSSLMYSHIGFNTIEFFLE